eukprot:s325_g1.t1
MAEVEAVLPESRKWMKGESVAALSSTAQEEEQRAERLKRFRSQCQELLRLTRDLEKLPGPNFKVAKVGRPKAKAKALPAVAVPAAAVERVLRSAPVQEAPKEPPAAALNLTKPQEPQEVEEDLEDVQVFVQGVPHLFSIVLQDDELQEQMTDQEYQRQWFLCVLNSAMLR